MILVLVVLMLLTALGATLGAVTLDNLRSSLRADEAARVVNAAEAGVAQAMTFIRQNGVGALRCRAADPAAATPTWTDCAGVYGRSAPVGSPSGLPDGIRYWTWVEEVSRFTPNSDAQGVYRIHATGTLSGGARASCHGVEGACRSVTVEVVVTDFGLGAGIYSKSIQGNSAGASTVRDQSVFTSGCLPKRGSLDVSGFDAAHGIPAGVHTSGLIVDAPVSKCDKASNSIHASRACNTSFPFDQDVRGGSLGGTTCWTRLQQETPGGVPNEDVYGVAGTGVPDGVWGSRVDSQAAMEDTFGLQYPPLDANEVERLQAIAQEDGTYRTTPTWPAAAIAQASRGVFFFDLAASSQTEVNLAAMPAPFNTEPAACSGAVVVIQDGNAKIASSNKDSVVGASVFLLSSSGARGIATLNGGKLHGGLFAEAIDFGGNVLLEPADCTDGSSNPALLTVTMTSYSEDD